MSSTRPAYPRCARWTRSAAGIGLRRLGSASVDGLGHTDRRRPRDAGHRARLVGLCGGLPRQQGARSRRVRSARRERDGEGRDRRSASRAPGPALGDHRDARDDGGLRRAPRARAQARQRLVAHGGSRDVHRSRPPLRAAARRCDQRRVERCRADAIARTWFRSEPAASRASGRTARTTCCVRRSPLAGAPGAGASSARRLRSPRRRARRAR